MKLPPRYPFAEEVPEDGASCATCYFLNTDDDTCRNRFYIKEHGSSELGDAPKRWCCMAWSESARK